MSKQLRMLCVVDQENGQPLFYRAVPGNILDMSTLQNTLTELKEMELSCSFVLLDAGYFSEDNTNSMYEQNINFLTRMQKSRLIYKTLLKTELFDLETVAYVATSGKRGIFAKCVEIKLFEHKAYAYIVLDPVRKGKEMQDLLIGAEKNTKSEIQQSELNSCGIVVFISSLKLDAKEVVSHYYTRNANSG
jgi:transposase